MAVFNQIESQSFQHFTNCVWQRCGFRLLFPFVLPAACGHRNLLYEHMQSLLCFNLEEIKFLPVKQKTKQIPPHCYSVRPCITIPPTTTHFFRRPCLPEYIPQIFWFAEGHSIDCYAPRHAGYRRSPASWVPLIDRLIDIFFLADRSPQDSAPARPRPKKKKKEKNPMREVNRSRGAVQIFIF